MPVLRLAPVVAILAAWSQAFPVCAATPPADDWAVFDKPGKFVTALCAAENALWIGTEDNGLWRLDLAADPAKAESWTQFAGKDGPNTEHVYAIAADTAGRVWVGTLNQGVSVYNGKEWRNYGVLDGCLGERVFAVAADPDPQRGSVWIGTDHGLVCWTPSHETSPAPPTAAAEAVAGTPAEKPLAPPADKSASAASGPPLAKGTWRTYTQADGLPSAQVYALAVDPKNGRVWVGTECDGLAWSDPPYQKWRAGWAEKERSGDEGEAPGVGEKGAPGLPSNLTNDLVVLPGGAVVLSTDYGLGIGRAGGRAWLSWQGLSKEPYENYARGLACDAEGGLWVGTRHKGLARLDLGSGALKTYCRVPREEAREGETPPAAAPPSLPDDYVFDVAVDGKGDVWAGTYGGGLARLRGAAPTGPPAAARGRSPKPKLPFGGEAPAQAGRPPAEMPQHPIAAATPPLPAPAGAPTLEELNGMLAAMARVPLVAAEQQPAVVRLDDDWLTKGDCLGRYGRYWGCWCAICSPRNYEWGAGPEKVEHHTRIGTHRRDGDTLRYWVHWLYTMNPNTLEMPATYHHSRVLKGLTTWDMLRRQAEWDDHGETYPMSAEGPDLYCTLKVPPGLYFLSLYNFNKDGHDGQNRLRDYAVSIRARAPGRELHDIDGFEKWPELARGRMRDFWGGAYKRFLVRGPTEITIRQSRNHSHNAILAGVFLDLVDEYPVPYFHTVEEWETLRSRKEAELRSLQAAWRQAGARARSCRPDETEAGAAGRLFEEVERMRLVNSVWWAREGRPMYAALLRWTTGAIRSETAGAEKMRLYGRATTCCYQLGLYEKWEAGQVVLGKTPARRIEKALRWDGVTFSYQGKGYEIVTAYLANGSAGEAARDAESRRESQP